MAIRNVSDTARWVAYYRAIESDRPDALFHDPFARSLAGPEGEAIVEELPGGRALAWPMIVRTAVFDEMILAAVSGGVTRVVNLAAGLDARPWRLGLPPSVIWMDVDLPDILDYKLEVLRDVTPVCQYDARRVDLTDSGERADFFSSLDADPAPTLVLTEGLLIYLAPEQVAALARDLAAHSCVRTWLIDIVSPRLLKYLTRHWGKALEAAASPFRFGPADSTSFFKSSGWHEAEFRSVSEEANRLQRGTWMMAALYHAGRLVPRRWREDFRRMSGIVRLQREPAGSTRTNRP